MTAAATTADHAPAHQRWLLLGAIVAMATLYSMTILVVSVILPQMQGALSATPDQISWTVTFNILATAVVTPLTGWLTARWGWRGVTLFCLGGFTVSTLFCGLAQNLEQLILFRFLQGGLGAPLIPMAQAVVLSTFPKHQHGMATSLFGMGVVIGPIFGPIFGGFVAELYDWRWVFFMIVPMAAVAYAMLWALLPDRGRKGPVDFAWTGFLALAVAITCLQLALDRGQRNDWFDSLEIMAEAAIGVAAFAVYLLHSLMARSPLLDLRLLVNRNYALGLVIVLVYGMLNFTPMVIMPTMLKDLGGYPESIIGILIAGRGMGAVVGFFSANWVARADPRFGITTGFLLQAWSGWQMMHFNMDVSMFDVMSASLAQGLAVGLIWVPLTVSTFARIDTAHMAETSAVFHLLRNIGSSIFISLSVTTIIRESAKKHAHLSEFITPYNEVLRNFDFGRLYDLGNVTDLARLNAQLIDQAQMVGFLNAFGLYTLACVAVLPLVFMIKPPARRAAADGA